MRFISLQCSPFSLHASASTCTIFFAPSFFPEGDSTCAVVYDSAMGSLSYTTKAMELTNLHFVPMINAAARNIEWWMHVRSKL